MASFDATVNVRVQGIDLVKTLIELLSKYADRLPDELNASINELTDSSALEFGVDDFQNMAGTSQKAETDFHTDQIITVNHVLKRVTFVDTDGAWGIAYPEKFRLGAAGKVFIQWGYE